MRLRIILAVLCVVILSSAGAQKVNYKVGLLGFYNLENLFDTIDDPDINDAEYLPSGTKDIRAKFIGIRSEILRKFFRKLELIFLLMVFLSLDMRKWKMKLCCAIL